MRNETAQMVWFWNRKSCLGSYFYDFLEMASEESGRSKRQLYVPSVQVLAIQVGTKVEGEGREEEARGEES